MENSDFVEDMAHEFLVDEQYVVNADDVLGVYMLIL